MMQRRQNLPEPEKKVFSSRTGPICWTLLQHFNDKFVSESTSIAKFVATEKEFEFLSALNLRPLL